jgi:large subunit ribosomal protein L7/L12
VSQATVPVTPAAKEQVKNEFTLKLQSFEAANKAKIIREVKGIVPGMNLVEAKKFVESLPKTLRENVTREEADKLVKLFESVGAVVKME